MRLTSAILLSLTAALFGWTAIIIASQFDRGQTLIWSGLLMPITWVLFVIYAYWSDHARRPFIVMGLTTIVSIIVISANWFGA